MTEATARPAPGPPRPYHFPAYTRTELSNGLTVLVAPVRRLPICTFSFVVDAGAELDPHGHEGCAVLTARAMEEGTRDCPGILFTERLERIGAALEAAADWDSALFSVTVMAERLPAALELVAGIITQPAIPEDDVERLRDERLSEIVQIRSEPRGLANETFSRVVYDTGSRYALPLGGTERSVRGLERDDLLRHHESFFAPARTTVIIAGDVQVEHAHRLIERVLGDWSVTPAPASPRRGTPASPSAHVHLVAREDAPQSELRVGHVGVPRNHEDYFPLVMMNAVLGGLFSSRINLNLREEHAYTYSAHSAFEWRRGAGPFAIRTAVESGATAAAVSEILKEVRRLRDEPVTEEELSLAREYLAGVFPIRFETSLAIAAALAQLVAYELPADFYDTYRAQIAAVSGDDVLRVARAHLRPEEMITVAVGDAELVRDTMQELGIGDVTELAIEDGDQPVSAAAASVSA